MCSLYFKIKTKKKQFVLAQKILRIKKKMKSPTQQKIKFRLDAQILDNKFK